MDKSQCGVQQCDQHVKAISYFIAMYTFSNTIGYVLMMGRVDYSITISCFGCGGPIFLLFTYIVKVSKVNLSVL